MAGARVPGVRATGKVRPAAKARGKLNPGAKASTNGQVKAQPPALDAKAVASEVLARSALGSPSTVLSVLGDKIADNAVLDKAAARKAFLKLSMVIHPDKLPDFPDATRAFQALVSAFDRVTSPQQSDVNVTDVPRQAALSRSNEGCYRTEVQCPRCEVPWGLPKEGNPDYCYNLMMQGARRFTCSTCLLSFGCCTAIHLCPHCHKAFEYQPECYHHKVTCGNPGCSSKFGFRLFHASENAQKAAQAQALQELTRWRRTEEARSGRAQRALRRAGGAPSAAAAAATATAAFAMGLRDVCPRCGLELEDYEDGEQLRHLRTCTSRAAHQAYRNRQSAEKQRAASAEQDEQRQLGAMSSAVWSMSGGRASQLWMLEDDVLRQRCRELGLATNGRREQLIERVAKRSPRDGVVTLPAAPLHSLADRDLSSVCAAHGLTGLKSRTERIEALEQLQVSGKVPNTAKAALVDDVKRPKSKAMSASAKLLSKPEAKRKVRARAEAKAKGKAKARAKAKAKVKAKILKKVPAARRGA